MAELRATKRNSVLGLLADALSPVADYLSTSTNPVADTGSDWSIAGLLGDTVRPIAKTVDRMSYGEPLTTGRGMTRQMRPDTRDALLAVSPMGAGTKAAGRATVAGAKALSPQAEKVLMDFVVKQGGIKPITAYHGTPHKFDKFSLDKIGTGEGAQVYGHGLYFADNPEVARSYQEAISSAKAPELYRARATAASAQNDINQIRSWLDGNSPWPINTKGKPVSRDFLEKRLSEYQGDLDWAKNVISNRTETGNFYKVDIPDEAVANMLLWDKPLSEQPEAVRKAWQTFTQQKPDYLDPKKVGGQYKNPVGKDVYGAFFEETPGIGQDTRAKVSEQLKQLGIPGIRYLDAGSRSAGEGSMNTVLFDDSLVKILERNGVPMQGLLK